MALSRWGAKRVKAPSLPCGSLVFASPVCFCWEREPPFLAKNASSKLVAGLLGPCFPRKPDETNECRLFTSDFANSLPLLRAFETFLATFLQSAPPAKASANRAAGWSGRVCYQLEGFSRSKEVGCRSSVTNSGARARIAPRSARSRRQIGRAHV